MFKVEIGYAGLVSRLQFEDKDSADLAYRKITDAQRNYKKFSNERTETVEVEHADGPAALALEGMISVIVQNLSPEHGEKHLRKAYVYEAMARRLRKEAGLTDDLMSPDAA